jgi:hypothetical protein
MKQASFYDYGNMSLPSAWVQESINLIALGGKKWINIM